jgi:hypothetical protein
MLQLSERGCCAVLTGRRSVSKVKRLLLRAWQVCKPAESKQVFRRGCSAGGIIITGAMQESLGFSNVP